MSTYFTVRGTGDAERLVPEPAAQSYWYADKLRGPAVTLALARAVERAATHRQDLRATRITFDIHSPVPDSPLEFRTSVLREGRRLLLADAELVSGDSVFSRARALFVAGGEPEPEPDGLLWSGNPPPAPPAAGLAELTAEGRLYWSESSEWGDDRGAHENTARKAVWSAAREFVRGESPTPLQLASTSADLANLTSNVLADGIGHINADVTLSIARLPFDGEVGVASLNRVESGSLVTGSAHLFNRRGPIGISTVSSMLTENPPRSFRANRDERGGPSR